MKARKDILSEIRRLSAEIATIKAAPESIEENEAGLRAFLADVAEAEDAVFDLAAAVLRGEASVADFVAIPPALMQRRAYLLSIGSLSAQRILTEARQRAASAIPDGTKPMTRIERRDALQRALRMRYEAALALVGELGEVDPETATELPAAALLGIPLDEAADAQVLDV